MDIQSLRLRLTDTDLVPLLAHLAEQTEGIEDLRARFSPEGLVVTGTYPTPFGFPVGFETIWEITTSGHEVHARLNTLKVAGVPASTFRGLLLKMAGDIIATIPGVRIDNDRVIANVVEVAKSEGIQVVLGPTTVAMGEGVCQVEVKSGDELRVEGRAGPTDKQ